MLSAGSGRLINFSSLTETVCYWLTKFYRSDLRVVVVKYPAKINHSQSPAGLNANTAAVETVCQHAWVPKDSGAHSSVERISGRGIDIVEQHDSGHTGVPHQRERACLESSSEQHRGRR